jgi:hypothetical protein
LGSVRLPKLSPDSLCKFVRHYLVLMPACYVIRQYLDDYLVLMPAKYFGNV